VTGVKWRTGVADVRAIKGLQIIVACPHCYGTHVHQRTCLGSSAVVAGCHTGFANCLEYSIPQRAEHREPPRRSGRAA
jgi:hypothetical protein